MVKRSPRRPNHSKPARQAASERGNSTDERRRTVAEKKSSVSRDAATVGNSPGVLIRTLRSVRQIDPASRISVLMGFALGLATIAMVVRLGPASSPDYLPPRAVLAGAIFAVAVGLAAPRGMAAWIYDMAWQRFARRARDGGLAASFFDRSDADRSLYWAVLSVISLVAGVLTALLPGFAGAVLSCYTFLREHFLWAPPVLSLLHLLVAFVICLLAFSAIGMAAGCVHHLGSRTPHWDPRITGWFIIGIGAGIATGVWFVPASGGPNAVLAAAALPLLAVSLLSVASGRPSDGHADCDRCDETAALPTRSDRWPAALHACTVTVGLCGLSAIAVWKDLLGMTTGGASLFVSLMLPATGLGFLLGCRPWSILPNGIGNYGVICAAAGAATAVGMFACAGRWWPGHLLPAIMTADVSMAAIGFALGLGHRVLLSSVADRSSAAVIVLSRIMVLGAMLLWLGIPFAIHILGKTASLAGVALTLLALGGSLVIHEPSYSPLTRRIRLLGIFGVVGVMILLAPTISPTTAPSHPDTPIISTSKGDAPKDR